MYRIMIEGEDHRIFCYGDNIKDKDIDKEYKEAQEDYPDGTIWVEQYNTIERELL